MPTYKLHIPVDVLIPVTTTAANESRALEIALAGVGEYLRTWSRKIGPTADISIREMPDNYPLTDELFVRGDPLLTLEEYSQKCQDALVAKGYLPKAIERIDVERHYKLGEKPEDVAEHLYYEDNLDMVVSEPIRNPWVEMTLNAKAYFEAYRGLCRLRIEVARLYEDKAWSKVDWKPHEECKKRAEFWVRSREYWKKKLEESFQREKDYMEGK